MLNLFILLMSALLACCQCRHAAIPIHAVCKYLSEISSVCKQQSLWDPVSCFLPLCMSHATDIPVLLKFPQHRHRISHEFVKLVSISAVFDRIPVLHKYIQAAMPCQSVERKV